MRTPCQLTSEYDPLRSVVVHEPGREIDSIVPSNKADLLFDDIPFLPTMQREHRDFVACLRSESDAEVLYLTDLLRPILADPIIRRRLVDEVTTRENCPGLAGHLFALQCDELLTALFAGVTQRQWEQEETESPLAETTYSLRALPNAYFMRDPAAIVGPTVISSKMHFPARDRESVLLKYVFHFHPQFKGRVDFAFGDSGAEDRPYTIEGGDVLVLGADAVAIGCSQRTRRDSIRVLATNLFAKDIVRRVYEVLIPNERSYMHLDTVFTIVDEDLVVVYPDAINQTAQTRLYHPEMIAGECRAVPEDLGLSFLEVLRREMPRFVTVLTGDGDPRAAEREQWADATNVLAVAPRRVITYDRNLETIRALRRHGVQVVEIAGSELVRGRGGPRCMTMPLRRGEP